jgi:hypothetical protein
VNPLRSVANGARSVEWILRIGAFLCFVGHGAFGLITKEAWLRYFAVVGIGRNIAYELMPLVGALDVTMGCVMLIVPLPIVAWWMLVWAVWTAALRPLSGEPIWEAFERGGNYGAPAAILIMMSHSRQWRGLFSSGFREVTPTVAASLGRGLTAAIVLLLIGHGALGVLGKVGLVENYSSMMSESAARWLTPRAGWFEILLGLGVALRPSPSLLVFVALWKIATEMLFVTAGFPVWEFVERGGSYCAPLALAVLLAQQTRVALRRSDAQRHHSPTQPRISTADPLRVASKS